MNIESFLLELSQLIENKKNLSTKYITANSSYNGFEHLVQELFPTICSKYPNVDYTFHFGHHFPDISIIINNKKYGIELKSRSNGSWDNNGGSVFESISDDNYEEIYILFGSLQKDLEKYYKVKFNTYWNVVDSIKVTHKPRYHINMNAKHTVFKDKEEYFKIRSFSEEQKNNFVQKKLRELATTPQWYLSNDNENIKPSSWNKLGSEKNIILAEMLILFAYDLLHHKNANYNTSCQYLITQYFCYSPSFRDIFSAGGSKNINNITVPAIVYTFYKQKDNILKIIDHPSSDFKEQAYSVWQKTHSLNSNLNFKQQFFSLLNNIGKNTLNTQLSNLLIKNNLTLSQLIFSE